MIAPRSESQEKLSTSLNISKFNIVRRRGFVGLLSSESNGSRMVQTAGEGKRSMRFNVLNKAELLYPERS